MTMLSVLRFYLLLVSYYGCLSVSQQDPLTDYCRRFAHQTTIIDNKLYIDGGLVDYGGYVLNDTVNSTNTFLLYLDLNTISPQNFPTEYANLSKPAYVPSVQGGILWPDTVKKLFYLYGGEYNWTTPPPSQFTLWAYDTIYDTGNATSSDITASDISSVSFGAGAVVNDKELAYYYGGWQSNATVLGWNGHPIAQPGLIKYDMILNQSYNLSFIDNTPRAEGIMLYIPASDAGMLVYLGGVQQTSNGSYTGTIYLYDLASGNYYSHDTSGTTPGMRRRFCGGVSWSADQSSYNIYFYGGLPPYDQQGLGYGDVWILSMPSFTWTQWYPSSNERHSLSCSVIDQSQMIIMGGYFPNSSNINCDAQSIWGQHNLNLGAEDVAQAEWYQYLPNVTSYEVPTTIIDVIGGGPTGGATLTTPTSGWANPDLATYFTRQYKPSTRTPTRYILTPGAATTSAVPSPTPSMHTSKTNVGAIAGGAVGGVVFVAAIILLACLCLRWRSRRRQEQEPIGGGGAQQVSHMTEQHVPGSADSMRKPQAGSQGYPSPQGSPQFQDAHQHSHNWQPQQYYAPPPQAQPYYPPPPVAQQNDQSSPISELPNVRSPPVG